MDITTPEGKRRPVAVGLVDKQGAFFLFLDSNEVRHLKFSDESSLISELYAELARQTKRIDALEKTNEKLAKKLENAKKTNDAKEDYIEKLADQVADSKVKDER